MEYIEIPVKEYYFAGALYAKMPRPVFDALEAAYLNGSPTARVPAEAFRAMQEGCVL